MIYFVNKIAYFAQDFYYYFVIKSPKLQIFKEFLFWFPDTCVPMTIMGLFTRLLDIKIEIFLLLGDSVHRLNLRPPFIWILAHASLNY